VKTNPIYPEAVEPSRPLDMIDLARHIAFGPQAAIRAAQATAEQAALHPPAPVDATDPAYVDFGDMHLPTQRDRDAYTLGALQVRVRDLAKDRHTLANDVQRLRLEAVRNERRIRDLEGGISDACDLLARDMFDPEDDHEQPRRFRICLYHRDMRARCGACETCGWHRDGVRGAACQCGGGE
jgi:hypothetical protein